MTEDEHLAKTSDHIQGVYRRYRKAIRAFGDDVTVNPTKVKYIGFVVDNGRKSRRMANFHIGKQSLKIWLNLKTIKDPKRLTLRTAAGHTVGVKDDQNFDYIVELLRQAYLKNK